MDLGKFGEISNPIGALCTELVGYRLTQVLGFLFISVDAEQLGAVRSIFLRSSETNTRSRAGNYDQTAIKIICADFRTQLLIAQHRSDI